RVSEGALPYSAANGSLADAGACFHLRPPLHFSVCLPSVINLGVQKAGTGELLRWLELHPRVVAHQGEVHFFDTVSRTAYLRHASVPTLQRKYAAFLGKRREPMRLLAGKVVYEKTPAYFDLVDPLKLYSLVPSAAFLVMLRMPAERAISAYNMCKEMEQRCAVLPRSLSPSLCLPASIHPSIPSLSNRFASPDLAQAFQSHVSHGSMYLLNLCCYFLSTCHVQIFHIMS
ncbi:MAG: hypothetical protein SGPRY_013902, partial [Prymnesium sp.]